MTQATNNYPFAPILETSASQRDYVSTAYNLGMKALETTQRHVFGRRYVTWDGKVFKYGHSLGTLYAGYGAANISNGSSNTIARLINSVTPAAYSIGDRKILVTVAATEAYAGDGVIAENELQGAYLVLGHGSAATTENFTVMANTAVASGGGTMWVTLDAPIGVAHDAGVALELPLNPYRYLSKGSFDYNAFMCVPSIAVTSGYNFWGQTYGPCWVVPGGGDSTPGDTADDRTAYFVGDGSVNFGYALTIETGYQRAGFCIDPTVSGTGAMPLIMLDISI
jgi:hypothetical protein